MTGPSCTLRVRTPETSAIVKIPMFADLGVYMLKEERGLYMSEEELRELLLAEVYAGAFSGLGAMLLDEDRIRNAGAEELEELARDS